jgi:hypothetical protein
MRVGELFGFGQYQDSSIAGLGQYAGDNRSVYNQPFMGQYQDSSIAGLDQYRGDNSSVYTQPFLGAEAVVAKHHKKHHGGHFEIHDASGALVAKGHGWVKIVGGGLTIVRVKGMHHKKAAMPAAPVATPVQGLF